MYAKLKILFFVKLTYFIKDLLNSQVPVMVFRFLNIYFTDFVLLLLQHFLEVFFNYRLLNWNCVAISTFMSVLIGSIVNGISIDLPTYVVYHEEISR